MWLLQSVPLCILRFSFYHFPNTGNNLQEQPVQSFCDVICTHIQPTTALPIDAEVVRKEIRHAGRSEVVKSFLSEQKSPEEDAVLYRKSLETMENRCNVTVTLSEKARTQAC